MGLLVINPGLFTTVQDLGREGYREWGVPIGGTFDRASAALANALVGNPPGEGVLELTLIGGTYEAQVSLALALAGAPMDARVEGAEGRARQWFVPQSGTLGAGERLVLGRAAVGARTYLAVRGGWRTPLLLGSRSCEDRLQPGAVVPAEPGTIPVRRPAESVWCDPTRAPLRVLDGPDAADGPDPVDWDARTFRVGRQSDRMGLRLEGPTLGIASPPDRVSAPVAPGAVQVAGGQAIVLGIACGTMGGYPHLAQVISADLDRLGQFRPDDELRFQRVTLAEARRIDREARRARVERLRRVVTLAADDIDLPIRD
jgi:5-oxoprolinase (ATP-hydrolysing) subunit C